MDIRAWLFDTTIYLDDLHNIYRMLLHMALDVRYLQLRPHDEALPRTYAVRYRHDELHYVFTKFL